MVLTPTSEEVLIGGLSYEPNLFELMKANTDVAIRRAKKQYEAYPKDTPASLRCPATVMGRRDFSFCLKILGNLNPLPPAQIPKPPDHNSKLLRYLSKSFKIQ